MNTHWRTLYILLTFFSHRCLCAFLSTSLIFPVADGSFCIQFPANYPGDDSGRIWYVRICLDILLVYKCISKLLSCMVRRPQMLINSHNSHTAKRTKNNRTSYDAAKKQHWLSVYKHELLGRYPLHQGEGEWACQMEKYMMRTTVDRMVERISEADGKSDAGTAIS